jgi:manganese/zinc/iron transport system substrate-binding protein
MHLFKTLLLSVTAALTLMTAAGRCSAAAPAKRPFTIVTTVAMVTDIVREVAGDKAQVVGLIGPGVDPHLYKATRDDVAKLMSADVIFYSGLMLEGKMTDSLIKVSRGKPVCAVTERIDEKFLLEPEGMAGHFDPHVWMDVSAWSQCVDAVATALGEYDSANAESYRANAAAYRKQLEALHEYGKQVIATIPERGRVLITSHDAFNYFGRAYGLNVMGVQGISTESEAGLQDLNRLVDDIVRHDVKAVFVESSVSPKSIQSLIEGAASRGKAVTIGGELFSDAMGAAGTYEGTYIGMLDHNITLVTRALGGEAPERGLQGKLAANQAK